MPSSSLRASMSPLALRVSFLASTLFLSTFVGAVFAADESEGSAAAPASAEPATYQHPALDLGVLTFDARRADQTKALTAAGVVRDFAYADRIAESGIDFVHTVVEDASSDYMPVHYDHGTGVVVADFDGDGREDLFFVDQRDANAMYRNLGEGRFENVTERAGVAFPERTGVTAAAADFDGDGDADLLFTTVRFGNVLLQNDGTGRFQDVSKAWGIDGAKHSSGAVFFDFDLDGDLDLFVTNVGVYTHDEKRSAGNWVGRDDAFSGHLFEERFEQSVLYRNEGDRFVDVSAEVGLVDTSWSGDASFVDLDGDRYPELYVLNMQGDDHYWVGKEGKGFVDRRAQVFPKTPWGAMGIGFLDFDLDGDQDLYLTDMHSDMMEKIQYEDEAKKSRVDPSLPGLQGGDDNVFGNAFYVNQGDGSFAERSDALGVENYWPWGLSVGDVNADGYEDLFVASSMNFPFRYQPNSLFMNAGGQRFHDGAFVLGVEPRRGKETHVPWFEIDCGGADAEHDMCEKSGAKGPLQVIGSLGTRSSAIFDLDGDGDLDIVTNEFGTPPQVLVSDLAQRREIHWLQVALEGTDSNRDGLGATVTVEAGGRSQVRYANGKSGYLSQSRMPLYFGLGDAKKIDRVTVAWPSGKVQTLDDIAPNQRLRVVEPSSSVGEESSSEAEPLASL